MIGGVTIETVRSPVKGNLIDKQPRDLVVVEGRGNALLEVEKRRTLSAIREIVKMVKEREDTSPFAVCI